MGTILTSGTNDLNNVGCFQLTGIFTEVEIPGGVFYWALNPSGQLSPSA